MVHYLQLINIYTTC